MTGDSDDGQAGVVVTEADQRAALRVVRDIGLVPLGHDMKPAAEIVAGALVEARVEAREPLVALIERIRELAPSAVKAAEAEQ